ncbi:MAG: 50S ribosomal protein L4 [Elusimicrobia bacterium RIFOXYA2_FULL_58_8]|nr:MAG: 50S ribosomal protein L4 [Elusimicrobia bacterium RIFOXYA2_FULL_58_8]OGS13722.1 MAG: 50S ribosomal protein L4 [Elusimicrobia bacterium RIFOXYA12_FULL_57_11]
METKLLNISGKEIGTATMPEPLFSVKPDKYFLHEIVTAYLANKHRGTACTKTRSEISGGGKKPWKQKGTGRARSGSTRSPIWRKGGVVFGPKPRSFRQYLPQQKLRQGLIAALSARHADGAVLVIENLNMETAKTSALAALRKSLSPAGKRVLFVTDVTEKNFVAASKNFSEFGWCLAKNLNAYEAMRNHKLVFTAAGLKALAEKVKEN